MDLIFRVEKRDTDIVKDLVRSHKGDRFVVDRIDRNVKGNRRKATKSHCWRVHLMCLLTTQQTSGPKSPVYRFLTTRPFPLRLATVQGKKDPATFISNALKRSGGIRRHGIIADQAVKNLKWFSGPNWRILRSQLDDLESHRGFHREREVANWLTENFAGLGPKQSRNFLQALGLSRYEIPIDSRVTKWLRNDLALPISTSSEVLNNRDYYALVNDAIHELCRQAGVLPCVLDAVLFSRVDKGEWDEISRVF